MPFDFVPLALPLVSTLGALFVLMMVARDHEARPISLRMALWCGAISRIAPEAASARWKGANLPVFNSGYDR
jgi:hypothetical protein